MIALVLVSNSNGVNSNLMLVLMIVLMQVVSNSNGVNSNLRQLSFTIISTEFQTPTE